MRHEYRASVEIEVRPASANDVDFIVSVQEAPHAPGIPTSHLSRDRACRYRATRPTRVHCYRGRQTCRNDAVRIRRGCALDCRAPPPSCRQSRPRHRNCGASVGDQLVLRDDKSASALAGCSRIKPPCKMHCMSARALYTRVLTAMGSRTRTAVFRTSVFTGCSFRIDYQPASSRASTFAAMSSSAAIFGRVAFLPWPEFKFC